jgi:hypothetical protein
MSSPPSTDEIEREAQPAVEPRRRRFELTQDDWWRVGGGLASLVIAVVLFSRYSIHDLLSRDESIYVYGGQRLTHGVAPYVSIMDPKGPISTLLCGLGAGIAKLFGGNDLMVIRGLFLIISLLCVLAVYAIVVQFWQSVVGGVVAATVFAAFQGFAHDAIAGPDAKVPGILCLLLAMWLGARRHWYWAACTASLAFFTWQPFFPFPLVAVIGAAVWAVGERRKAVGLAIAGAATPLVALLVYFSAAGALGTFINSAFVFPLRGVRRSHETVDQRIHRIIHVVSASYRFSGNLLWAGMLLLVLVWVASLLRDRTQLRAALTSPLTLLIFITFLAEVGYACYDFQGYPDVFPLLPYAAIGFGGAVALAMHLVPRPRPAQVVGATALTAAAALAIGSAVLFTDAPDNRDGLYGEQAAACAIKLALVPGTSVYSLGDPTPLVLLRRANPDHYIFLGSGLDVWKVKHTKDGFLGWVEQIAANNPSVVVLNQWNGPWKVPMRHWLRQQGYRRGAIGSWQVFVTRAALSRMAEQGVALQRVKQGFPRTSQGGKFDPARCPA